MIDGVIIKKIDKYTDDRGWLAEAYRRDEIDYIPSMTYISVTKPGVARGPHEHVRQSDYFIFMGPGFFDLYLWDNRKESKTFGEHVKMRVGEDNPTFVIVPPGVVHGYKCVSETNAWSINNPDKLYKGLNKTEEVDEIRWEKDENSPFKI